eukprot:gene37305-50342_t
MALLTTLHLSGNLFS